MTTPAVGISKPPSTICGGFIDVHGVWNNGFECPIQQFVQYFCCGTDNYHYCCTPDRFLSEIQSYNDQISIAGPSRSSQHIIMDQTPSPSLIDQSRRVNQQFEQFQKVFLPIFLLTSSMLFLVGLAIWFWLYKHKAFYATERDDDTTDSSPDRRKASQTERRESTLSTTEHVAQLTIHPVTEV